MLVFTRIPKTAGQSVVACLRGSFGIAHCDIEAIRGRPVDVGAEDLAFAQALHPPLASIAGHRVRPSSDLSSHRSGLRYFTFLREPLARAASQYQYRVRRLGIPTRFADWVATQGNAQTRYLAGGPDLEAAMRAIGTGRVHVGVTEWFEESLILLRARIAPKMSLAVERLNVARDDVILRELLADPASRRRLEEENRLDRELYRFVCREVIPGYREEYGPGLSEAVRELRVRRPRAWWPRVTANKIYRHVVYKPALRAARLRSRGGRPSNKGTAR